MKVMMQMPNGEIIKTEIKNWQAYNTQIVRITTVDEKTYHVHASNCCIYDD